MSAVQQRSELQMKVGRVWNLGLDEITYRSLALCWLESWGSNAWKGPTKEHEEGQTAKEKETKHGACKTPSQVFDRRGND